MVKPSSKLSEQKYFRSLVARISNEQVHKESMNIREDALLGGTACINMSAVDSTVSFRANPVHRARNHVASLKLVVTIALIANEYVQALVLGEPDSLSDPILSLHEWAMRLPAAAKHKYGIYIAVWTLRVYGANYNPIFRPSHKSNIRAHARSVRMEPMYGILASHNPP
jgi:hypothetical protein